MVNFTRVPMNLTDRDISNTQKIQDKLHARSRANAVSSALFNAAFITAHLFYGKQMYMLTRDGKTERLILPGL